MKEILTDVIKFTKGVGDLFDSYKIVIDNDTGKAEVWSSSKSNDVLLSGILKAPLPSFINANNATPKNVIGFMNLDVLSGYLRSPFFDNATIDVNTRQDGVVTNLVFKSEQGHVCTYRTLDPAMAKSRIRTFKSLADMPDPSFTFVPTSAFIDDFSNIAAILGNVAMHFNFNTAKGVLNVELSGDDNQATIPVTACDTQVYSGNRFPIKSFLTIIKKAPDLSKVIVNIYNDHGCMDIIVDTDHAVYSYLLNSNQ